MKEGHLDRRLLFQEHPQGVAPVEGKRGGWSEIEGGKREAGGGQSLEGVVLVAWWYRCKKDIWTEEFFFRSIHKVSHLHSRGRGG
jgi:hypothetical protein